MIIEEALITHLQGAQITDVGNDVYAETPKTVPDNYIVIDKTGSGRTNMLDRVTVAIQSISSVSLLKAAQINEEVMRNMLGYEKQDGTVDMGLVKVPNIFGCHLQSDYNFTDTRTKQHRYQAVYEITYKR